MYSKTMLIAATFAIIGGITAAPQSPAPYNVASSEPIYKPVKPTSAKSYGTPDKDAHIISQVNEISPDGYFKYSFQSDNGLGVDVQGSQQPSKVGPEKSALAVQGSYTYTDTEGKPVVVQYTADENGFRPAGDVIDPAIVKALQTLPTGPAEDGKTEYISSEKEKYTK